MKGKLFFTKVTHQRIEPKKHDFVINSFWFGLDLLNLPESSQLLKIEKMAPYSFYAKDHLPRFQGSIQEKIQKSLNFHGVNHSLKQAYLITNLRTFGYIFNPVSYFFCLLENGQSICLIEICNTYREVKTFLAKSETDFHYQLKAPKNFYISPFIPTESTLDFLLFFNGDELDFTVKTSSQEKLTMVAKAKSLKSCEINFKTLMYSLFRFPFMTIQVISLIHWQALLLFLKRIPYFKKSTNLNLQSGYTKWTK